MIVGNENGFSIIYENEDGSAEFGCVHFENGLLNKIRFTDIEESRVVLVRTRKIADDDLFASKNPFASPMISGQEDCEVKEIVIRRDFQIRRS